MVEKKIIVKISSGLEARPIAVFVQLASQFKSSVYVQVQDKRVNAKSIMGMMSLGVLEGEEVLLTVNGEDEEEACNKLEQYLSEKQ